MSPTPSVPGLPRTLLHSAVLLLASGLAPATAQFGAVDLDTVRAGRFDAGKMWTFEYAPDRYFSETYGFDANAAWFERARMAALRIPGCSASFVSPHGLLATNHHCVRGAITRVARPGESLLDDGFSAANVDAERRIPGYYADQLIAIEDVTEEVFGATDRAADDAARTRAREAALRQIEQRLLQRHAARGDSIWVQLIDLYHGGRYSAYVFRRHTDIRLVAAAELQLGFFGGDPDNFTYPRYALDFAFLRVYGADGRPYQTEHYFGWGSDGVETGDVVFVIGNPGPTNRLNTVAQLEYQRDVDLPIAVAWLESRHRALGAYRAERPEEAEAYDVRNLMFSLSNSLKASTGRLAALIDPVIMARRRDAERQLRTAIERNRELRARYGTVIDRLGALQQDRAALAAAAGAFRALGNARFGSATLRRAFAARQYLDAPRDSLDVYRERLLQIEDHPAPLEQRFLAARFRDFDRYLGADHPITRAALRGMAPDAAAAAMLRDSELSEAVRLRRALDAGSLPPEDPALQLATVLLPDYRQYVADVTRLQRAEEPLASDLGRARFAVYGRDVPPDATFSPRITDGVVQGYEYNGTLAPPYTTFHGMYDRYYAHAHPSDWDLPPRWQTPPTGLDLRTPLNFVSTADTYGGNSGSPAVTPALALVGLNFDRNIEGLSRDYIYLPERGRNVMVDVRAIQAALDHVYDADRIVRELLTGRLFRTEEEADAAAR